MKVVIRAVIFSLICVVSFSYIYLLLGKDHFINHMSNPIEYIDYLFLATTIQSGVGYSDIYPKTYTGKVALIIQQFMMITSYVFILYFFTL